MKVATVVIEVGARHIEKYAKDLAQFGDVVVENSSWGGVHAHCALMDGVSAEALSLWCRARKLMLYLTDLPEEVWKGKWRTRNKPESEVERLEREARLEKSKVKLWDYRQSIMVLRQKRYTFQFIADRLSLAGIKVSRSQVYSTFRKAQQEQAAAQRTQPQRGGSEAKA